MHHDFWHERWLTGQTGFHQSAVHPLLERWWPSLDVPAGARVYVPLCGKTLDMTWLADRGHRVVGSELSSIAIHDFFAAGGLDEHQAAEGDYIRHTAGAFEILEGDALALTPQVTGPLDAFYDRAALVALPPGMREPYFATLAALLPQGASGLLDRVRVPAGNEGWAAVLGRDRGDRTALQRPLFAARTRTDRRTRRESEVRRTRDTGAPRDRVRSAAHMNSEQGKGDLSSQGGRASGSWWPWVMAVTGMLVLLVSNGLTATALSVYDESLLNEFGWSRGELKFRDLVTFWLVAMIAPFAGVFIDRIGPKRMLSIGCVLLTIGYVLYSRLDSLAMLYAIHVILALGLLGASTMTCVILISGWFYSQRGLAIGIALVGTSLGSIILSPVNALMIERFGWRQAFLIEAALPIVLLVFILLVVRNSPRDVGTVAHGLDQSAGRDLRLEGLSLQEAMRTRTFWAIGLSGMMIYYSILALYNHLFLYLRGLGFEPLKAGFALSLLGLLGLTGKLINGALADRIDRHKVFLACQAIMLVGVALLASQRANLVLVSIAVIGLGWGGLFTLYNMLAVSNFGLRSAGKIGGVISLMESLGGGLGIWLTGVLYDRTDSYQQAFLLILGLVFTGLLLGTQIRSEVK